jgi:LPS-assembly lipoprotein
MLFSNLPFRAYAVCLISLMMSGCFQPIYASKSGADLVHELHLITIDPVPERLGHYLSNELAFALNGTGETISPRYRLSLKPRERVETPVIDTVSGRASAATIVIDTEYNLVRMADGTVMAHGIATSSAGYDRSSQRFANISAARDAEIRDAKIIAEQIKERLIIALSNKS